MFSKKASKNDKIFTVKLTVKILSFFVAFLENMNFKILSEVKKFFFSNFCDYPRHLQSKEFYADISINMNSWR